MLGPIGTLQRVVPRLCLFRQLITRHYRSCENIYLAAFIIGRPARTTQSRATDAKFSPVKMVNGLMLSTISSVEDARRWLAAHNFSMHLATFSNYSGADLLGLERHDLVELCGVQEGTKLFIDLQNAHDLSLHLHYAATVEVT